MLLHLLLISAFLGRSSAEEKVVKDIDCVMRMEAVHECRSDAREHYEIETDDPDGRADFEERKFCNWMTTAYEDCTKSIIGDCFDIEEVHFWVDADLKEYFAQVNKTDWQFPNWDSQKCPPFKKMLDRDAANENEEGVELSECQMANQRFQDCRDRAFIEFEDAEYDRTPFFQERILCNIETALLSTCPSELKGCKTEEELERMTYWVLINDDFEYETWDSNKCPAVKRVVTKWKALKESFKNTLQDSKGLKPTLQKKCNTVPNNMCAVVYDNIGCSGWKLNIPEGEIIFNWWDPIYSWYRNDIEAVSVKAGCDFTGYDAVNMSGKNITISAGSANKHVTLKDEDELADFDEKIESISCTCRN